MTTQVLEVELEGFEGQLRAAIERLEASSGRSPDDDHTIAGVSVLLRGMLASVRHIRSSR